MRNSTHAKKRRPSAVAVRVRNLRKAKGLSARALDRRAGLCGGYTARLECGDRTRPELDTIGKLARALGVSIDWLANGQVSS